MVVNIRLLKQLQLYTKPVKPFQELTGLQRGKNDCLDAKRIALYAYKNKDSIKLWISPREVITKLKKLNTLPDRILATKKMLATLVNEEKEFVDKATYTLLCEHIQKSQKALKNDLN